MNLVSEPLPGVMVLEPFIHRDPRGDFVKPYHEEDFQQLGIHFQMKEEFFSTSTSGVIRGMHFQLPPHAHQKLVYCVAGRVLDVVLDLRKASPTYGKFAEIELSASNHHVIFIPVGFAHGFASVEDGSCLVYKTDAVHAPAYDGGVLWNSFGCAWPFEIPLLSQRDASLPPFSGFFSPF